MTSSSGSLRLFPHWALLLFFILLLSGTAFLAPGAHAGSEPMEPLPMALPASHPPLAQNSGGYVGAQTCAQCHAVEYQHWLGSQHAKAESWLNIGLIDIDQRQFAKAEAAYRAALDLQPDFTQAAVNLADLYRIQGRDADGEKTLRQALALEPQNAAAHHALGLLLIRQKRLPEALAALAEAARLGSDNPRYGYVYAVALNGAGQGPRAIQTLETVLAKHPTTAIPSWRWPRSNAMLETSTRRGATLAAGRHWSRTIPRCGRC